MAARLRPQHSDQVRAKIKTSQLINRLSDYALSTAENEAKVELSTGQLKAIEILLRKSLPDLSAVQVTGGEEGDAPVRVQLIDGGSK